MSRTDVAVSEKAKRVDQAIALLQLEHVLDRRPYQLSGGEQQRVAVGRLMVRRPALWLLDEPFGHLDAGTKTEFRQQLHLLRRHIPTTMMVVTHDPVEAQTLGQRLAVLEMGRLRQVDEPATIHARPADRFVAGFLGWPAMNLTDGILVRSPEPDKGILFAAADGSFRLPVPAELVTHDAAGQPVTVGIRPEDLQAASASPSIRDESIILPGWHVQVWECILPRWLTTAERGGQRWKFWSNGAMPIGSELDLVLRADRLHWFDSRSGLRLVPRPCGNRGD